MRARRPSFVVALALVASSAALVAPSTTAAASAAAPVAAAVVPAADPATPATVRADVLPAPQINGVVWRQAIGGNFVYAGGQFTKARPFGSKAGVNEVSRSNLLAYNLTTGALDTTFAPSVNGTIFDVAVTPDAKKLIIVGSFTKVGTATRNRVAVFDLPSRTLSSTVVPNVNGQVKGVAATNSTIYLGGSFSTINGSGRNRVGAVSATNGALTPFQLPVDNGTVASVVVGPNGDQVVIGGTFSSVGGGSHPGYGLYRADVATNQGLPLPANESYRNAGANAGTYHLAADSTSFYGSGWNYRGGGGGGNNEGYFQASWSDGPLVNLNDCHGDGYDVAPIGDVVYLAAHSHNCITGGTVPQSAPKLTYWHSSAWTKATTGINTKDAYGYPDNPGTPHPGQLPWYPTWTTGTFTGQNQAVWAVTGNSQYVVYGGEFTNVDGVSQQGLARFAVRSIAPNKVGPQQPARGTFTTRARSFAPGEVRVSWPALWDRDDLTLTYHLLRNGQDIYQTSQDATQWSGQGMTYTDKNLAPGSMPSYVVRAVDPDGNPVSTAAAVVTVAGANGLDPYATQVLGDGATKFWRLDDSGSTVADLSGPDYTTAGAGISRGTSGAMLNSNNTASTFNGTATGVAVSNNRIMAPTTFTEEVWFRTTSTTGGTIASFGDGDATGTSFHRDRQIYMDGTGAVVFATKKLWVPTRITSGPGLDDGKWHQAVASFGSTGMAFYVDGVSVGTNPQVTAEDYAGYWRVGGDSSYLWSTTYFSGAIDDFSVYPTVLSAAQVSQHYAASGRSVGPPPNADPTASFKATPTGVDVAVDGSGSTDSDGTIASYSWDWGDGSAASSGPTAQHTYVAGTYTITLTVTDDDGATAQATKVMTVPVPNQKPTAAFTATPTLLSVAVDGGGSEDTDGTIQNYHWVWDDGSSTDTAGPTTSHDYAASGTYSVTLTVTDDAGDPSPAVTHQVVVSDNPPTNEKPTAAFGVTPTGLSVAADGGASADTDGTIAHYAWDWGDGKTDDTGSTATATHTYVGPGRYSVKLTVPDDDGATSDVVTHDVTVAANAILARDDFDRTVANGWGNAPLGGVWTLGTKSQYSVAPGAGTINIPTSGRPTADLKSVTTTNTDTTVEFSVDKVVEATYVGINERQVGAESYNGRIRIAANGTVQLYTLQTSTAVASATIPGLVITPGTKYRLRFQVKGVSPTTVSAKVWPSAQTEPTAWQLTNQVTKTPVAALQGPGYVGLYSYIPSGGPLNTTFYSYLVSAS